MAEEEKILKNLRTKEEQMNHQRNQGLEIQASTSQDGSFVGNDNQTYKLIMSNQDMSNHEGFSIEDDSDPESEESEEESEKYFDNHPNSKQDNILSNVNIEPIVEEDGEESKYAPTPQKPISSKIKGNRAIEAVKELKSKELEKRLEMEESEKGGKNFKSADAQKHKATLRDDKKIKPNKLPPRVPNRSGVSIGYNQKGVTPTNQLKNYTKIIPSGTRTSSSNETPKSITSAGPIKSNPLKKNTMNESQNSSECGKQNVESSRALMLYETPTVASQQKKQEVFKAEENLPPWGIQSVNTKHVAGKRTPSATTRSTVTPRTNNLKRGKTTVNCTALVVKEDSVNKTHSHIRKDVKIRKNKRNKSKQIAKRQER